MLFFVEHIQEKEALRREFDEERKELLEQIASLESENKKYLDTIIRHSKGLASTPPSTGKKETIKTAQISLPPYLYLYFNLHCCLERNPLQEKEKL